ncbi:MAG: hypothetical protein B6I30_01640 [Desulfobacteraceae bacterium 4572_187]|nr:MAG: hypothetical protein B6I30_01640 [Desulfobacteraceae bacterium 4572_187]
MKITVDYREKTSGLIDLFKKAILTIQTRNSSLFLWFCSFGSAKSGPNLSANSAKLFLREPLQKRIFNLSGIAAFYKIVKRFYFYFLLDIPLQNMFNC